MRNAAQWTRRFARTAPGVIGAVGAALALLALIAGLVSANAQSAKISRHDTALAHTEPLANAAQRLYVALSTADAAASTAYLSGGVESHEVRTRYENALTDAAAALAEATTGASDTRTREILGKISAELPTYTGYVEDARANNRQGLPVGSAYLRQASALMQGSILKNAGELQTIRLNQLHGDQDAITGLPLWASGLLVLLLAACGAGSWVLLRRTNRWVNAGVVTAAGLTVLALLWILATTIAASEAIDTGATARFEKLAQARILAQQARTEETLQLITRGNLDASEQRFAASSDQLRADLTGLLRADSPASKAFSGWQDGHRKEVAAYLSNNYRGAVDQSIKADGTGSAAQFTALDEALKAELERTRQEVRDDVNTAGNALTLSPIGTLALLLAATAAIVIGVWPRLKEFL
ncbi:protein kinase G-activating protein GlnX [Nocardia sp. JMUB6875]